MWEQRVVIELAPYHGASPCIITNPVIFFIDSGAKTSMSITACLAPHPFFLFFSTPVLRGNRPKTHRITGRKSRFVPCQLKISLVEESNTKSTRAWFRWRALRSPELRERERQKLAGWDARTFHTDRQTRADSFMLAMNNIFFTADTHTHTHKRYHSSGDINAELSLLWQPLKCYLKKKLFSEV